MRRREFGKLVGGAAVAWPLAARAQPSRSPPPAAGRPVIGFLNSASADGFAAFVGALSAGLAEAGYTEGESVMIEYRWAEGRYDRLPALAAELVRRSVDVIVATGSNAPALAAKAATATVPIVFVTGGDPVAAGLVASLARPGGNVTGISFVASLLVPKRLELLHQLVPEAKAIGALINPSYAEAALQRRELQEAGAALRRPIHILSASDSRGIDAAFASLEGTDALFVANDPFFVSRREQIVALATRRALPVIYPGREYVAAGGLLSYGSNLVQAFHQAGLYTARILRGAKPADLPVMQPGTFELVINLTAAKALGLAVPQSLLARADEVIE
jgi:putative tryptophan/tyrosine transport system substrate-binding protein